MPNPNRPASARAEAYELIEAFLQKGAFADRALPIGLTRELVNGTLRWLRQLEHIENASCRHRADRWTRAVLLTGFYEILHTRGADHAAVSERVQEVKTRRKQAVANMVNAVLRRCIRERDQWTQRFADAPLPLRTSHPDALVEGWRTWLDAEQTEAICAWNQSQPTTWARVRDITLPEAWREAGIHITSHPVFPDFVALHRPGPISKLPGFEQGGFYIQDPSTTLAPRLLKVRPGERVLDACAAPGGKTILLAEAMQGEGLLVAADRHEDRLPRLRENLERMQADWVHVRQEDARHPASPDERFDAILLDVPCSNSGVLARRPEARWRIDRKRLQQLHRTQLEVLRVSWARLADSGRLVYSTCSIEPIETTELVDAFLALEPRAVRRETQRNLPGQQQSDGTFSCLLTNIDAPA